ncbi:MAG: D-alanyl-lipoteichoic acid biosynthesis protein DltB [Anaerostipes sp.]|jgi:membrane protein involved in D-alanine export|nr:D-alanyl-lipoteichoic acid biosynthesis protein DltB [Anaerostipes sp.]MDD3746608.1 D-alanyl-lipoteichoic acid biosynthesis protein DltB [Anaerostipes sp.]
MSFFSGAPFFGVVFIIAILALLLGYTERPLKWLNVVTSILVVGFVLVEKPRQLFFFLMFYIIELVLVKGYLKIRTEKGRQVATYRIAVFLSIVPLILCKAGEIVCLYQIKWFQFVGISYLTFRCVQMIVESYDGVIKEIKVLDFTVFLMFFPTFSCGPIDRSRRFVEDFHKVYKRQEYLELFGTGLEKIFLGLVYKNVIATIFFQIMEELPKATIMEKFIHVYSYGFYMFFDFAGYSLMAIGVAYMLGIKVPENFKKPFLSVDMKDFWARWHISLSEWFRDFIFSRFIMLSMKKKWFPTRLFGASVGFIINMFVMGLWHGPSVHYILYGLYHGVLLALTEIYQKKSKFYKRNKKKKVYRFVSWFITFQLVMFGFLIFSGQLIAY